MSSSTSQSRLPSRPGSRSDTAVPKRDAASRALPAVDIGFVDTGNQQWTETLVRTLHASDPATKMRLLVVRNDPDDNHAALSDNSTPVVHLQNASPVGYAANGNRVIREAEADYVLFLNTDMYFDTDSACVQQMVRFMEDHPQCAAATCRVLHPDGANARSARRFPTVPMILGRRLPLVGARLFQRALDRYLYRAEDPLGSFRCEWISGCFMMLRREAVLAVGGFDERYPKYFEDVDLCQRLADAGWEIRYHGVPHCYHLEQRASRRWWSVDAVKHLRSYVRWSGKLRRRPSPVESDPPPHPVDVEVRV